ncbi:M14 family metallopeptidase [bacterium]|nr:M14 family metallopeptidase [bacterium]
MKYLVIGLICGLFSLFLNAQTDVDLDYYLPQNVSYDSSIPTPESVLGFQVGSWHVGHDQLVYYMRILAAASDRIAIEDIGQSHENRSLIHLRITSKRNQSNINLIQSSHLQLSDPGASASLALDKMPVVVWMGYTIHGNEPSGSNAALLVAYYLAAAQDPAIDRMLKDVVIILDPCMNPDGMNRFASWANSHKSMNLVTDPASREFHEAWPGGRTNHYWFDLNRDWLLLQHPESKARMDVFHKWKPNVLTDHHEMGSNSTFFFQPGVPSRNNPLTPQNTFTLTEKMGKYHAEALDKIGSLYFTKERFDDFYFGKGSTYPDINGAVGILFEQASSRGHAQKTIHGVLTFPFTIKNQVTTSLSTLKGAVELKSDLLNHQRQFYASALREADGDNVKGWIFGSEHDEASTYHMLEILLQHKIEVYRPARNLFFEGKNYSLKKSFIVPGKQAQFRLAKAIFEKRTVFKDSLFYDVSAWTIPLAFNLNYTELNSRNYAKSILGKRVERMSMPLGVVKGGMSSYAYAFEWNGYYSPRLVYELLKNDIVCKVATQPFKGTNGHEFPYGTIVIPVAIQKTRGEDLFKILADLSTENAIDIHTLKSGLNEGGPALGSNTFVSLKMPSILMLVDGNVRSTEAGEVWHLLDQRYHIPVTMAPVGSFSRLDLHKYNTLVMVDGNYAGMNHSGKEKLRQWIEGGGVVIATKGANRWVKHQSIAPLEFRSVSPDTTIVESYEDKSNVRGAQKIGGAIFEAKIDLSHPMGFGFEKPTISVFRNSTTTFEYEPKSKVNYPVVYTDNPLLSGYVSARNLKKIRGSASVKVSLIGKGRVIHLADNPNFRGIWYGTNKLFANAIFFGRVVR